MKAVVSIEEITALSKAKASGLAMSIYMILAAHDWGKGSSFPSIATISKRLANQYSKSSIHRCLKWLEDQGFIKRNEAKSKNRFVLLMRKVKAALKAEVSKIRHRGTENRTIRKKKKKLNTSYSKQKNNKIKNIVSWLNKMVDVRTLREARYSSQYSHLFASSALNEALYQYPPKPSENWSLQEVKQAFYEAHLGKPEEHWLWKLYLAEHGG